MTRWSLFLQTLSLLHHFLGLYCVNIAISCDDGNVCTVDSCDAVNGCEFVVAAGLFCDVGDACTTGDSCDANGSCVGSQADCNDGNVCTVDTCDPVSGCQNAPSGAPVCADNDGDGFAASLDCNDNDPDKFPGQVWYADCDGDGVHSSIASISCGVPATVCLDGLPPDGGLSHVAGTDCDDNDAGNFPGNFEVCTDGSDNNCDSLVDCADPACAIDLACGGGG